jgi:hypothetical protein
MYEKLITEFHRSCRDIVAVASNPAVNYAVGYARAGLAMNDPEEIRVQCLYIVGNISGWRGPIAVEARKVFKRLGDRKAWRKVA